MQLVVEVMGRVETLEHDSKCLGREELGSKGCAGSSRMLGELRSWGSWNQKQLWGYAQKP